MKSTIRTRAERLADELLGPGEELSDGAHKIELALRRERAIALRPKTQKTADGPRCYLRIEPGYLRIEPGNPNPDQQARKIEAIKLVRDLTDWSLATAKDAVERGCTMFVPMQTVVGIGARFREFGYIATVMT